MSKCVPFWSAPSMPLFMYNSWLGLVATIAATHAVVVATSTWVTTTCATCVAMAGPSRGPCAMPLSNRFRCPCVLNYCCSYDPHHVASKWHVKQVTSLLNAKLSNTIYFWHLSIRHYTLNYVKSISFNDTHSLILQNHEWMFSIEISLLIIIFTSQYIMVFNI